MASTQEHERSMLNALAASDVNMNTALGTPVRKIISAVASEMSQYAVDVNTTRTLYALDAVSGTELDYLVGQFGFTRQDAKAARGTVTIKRDNGDSVLQIAYGSQFSKPATATGPAVQFQTTAYQELAEGVLSAEIAVVAVTPGLLGNVPADTITHTGAYSTYITVTNENPTTGGRDAETDADLRTRFLNTVFRNVSGTRDQYAGLANAHEDVSRVNIVGQECRYSEIVQVVKADVSVEGGTTRTVYYVHPTVGDYDLDVDELIDADKRLWLRRTDSDSLIENTLYDKDDGLQPVNEAPVAPFALVFGGVDVEQTMLLEYEDADTCTCYLSYLPVFDDGADSVTVTVLHGEAVESGYEVNAQAGTIAFDSTVKDDLDGKYVVVGYKQVPVDEGEYVTIEFDYRSKHRREGTKTVDMFIDGEGPQLVSDIQFLDFDKVITSGNAPNWVRKDGSVPDGGHLYLILSRQPLIASTGAVNVGTSTILVEGTHFNVLYDATRNAGSIRGCDAIELIGSVDTDQFTFTANTNLKLHDMTPMNIPYHCNGDISTVQELIDSQSVMTMDVLVHGPKKRFFEISLDVMYSARPKGNISGAVVSALETWAAGLPFGATVQISDIETVAANVAGIDNVKLNSTAGISEFALAPLTPDGNAYITSYLTDFKLAQDEIFVLRNVVLNDRSQQNW